MRALVVEIGPEIEQLVFEICRRPEQSVIQVIAVNSGLEVRVLRGSPLVFNNLASSDLSEAKNCAQFCAPSGSTADPQIVPAAP
jgi:hypothetical protein